LQVLIGCDGSNSVVAKYLGMSPAKSAPRTFLRGFTRYPHGHPFGDHFLRLRGKRFFVGCSPITDTLVSFFVACHIPSTGRVLLAMHVNHHKDHLALPWPCHHQDACHLCVQAVRLISGPAQRLGPFPSGSRPDRGRPTDLWLVGPRRAALYKQEWGSHAR
jgi:hypothetical protein